VLVIFLLFLQLRISFQFYKNRIKDSWQRRN
jgi:hypothetical protein